VEVIGVIDLLGGQAVHARGGRRERYAPVARVAGAPIAAGNACALAQAYIERLGVGALYLADLDAIAGHATQAALIETIAACGVPLWLDSAVRAAADARRARALGATHVVVGLETLPSFDALSAICSTVGGAHVAFSLDLRNGVPVVAASGSVDAGDTPEATAARAAACGAGTVIVLDLTRVGSAMGPDLDLLSRVHAAIPGKALVAGGGIRDLRDLARLSAAGCDAALVATALQEGDLTADAISTARRPA
jgi:phosphoribosylformimino-5-aminoimidazole carboxamide ribotide isomerase